MLEFDKTLLFQFLNVLIMVFFLNFMLFKPVVKALRKRQDTIRNLGLKAEENRTEAEGFEKRYEETLKEKEAPIVEQRDSSLKEAHSASMKVIEEARTELAGELAKVKDAVKQEAAKTFDALKNESDRLSGEIAQKILQRGM